MYQAMGTSTGNTGEENLHSDSQWSIMGLAEYIMYCLAKSLSRPQRKKTKREHQFINQSTSSQTTKPHLFYFFDLISLTLCHSR